MFLFKLGISLVMTVSGVLCPISMGSMKSPCQSTANGTVMQFDTEEEACEAQRIHRVNVGLDPMTGSNEHQA